ncbi:hypothetical protein FIC_00089 [Flavobacteriaceae bacterium 3519-10]|nr:hypothetical protein FIC_00089 [Flavobacteriaceae bacterium 3519-10]
MKNIILGAFAFFVLAACTKSAEGNGAENKTIEAELVQKPVEFKNASGEAISVTYYSEGDVVAVKITPQGKAEQKLVAKTVNRNGNPVFTNDQYMWEITQDGQAGTLSDGAGNTTEYMKTESAN